jgi:hemoglobin-like flavoprotein
MKSQSRKLTAMITFLVHKLNNISEVKVDIVALGQRHVKYEVKPEYYQTVAVALLWTLEQGLGSQWTEEMKEAWTGLYTTLSGMMIEASRTPVAG